MYLCGYYNKYINIQTKTKPSVYFRFFDFDYFIYFISYFQ
jgi:hypothetical protein